MAQPLGRSLPQTIYKYSFNTINFCLSNAYRSLFSKEVDNELKIVCEQFIANISDSLITQVKDFLSKVNQL